MGGIPISAGLFLLFTYAFNGGIGEPIYNISTLLCAFCLIALGVLIQTGRLRSLHFHMVIIATISYFPLIHLHLTLLSSPDWFALVFDAIFMVVFTFLLIMTYPGVKRPD